MHFENGGDGPVVLLGFDAGDPDLIERWAAEGRLPALARMMARGSWARTSGDELLFEHGIWLSLFSGVPTAKHGFHFFWQLKPGSYELELVRGADCNIAPFWAQLHGTKRSVFVMDPPDTAPVPGLNGMQLCEWATHSHYPPLALAADPRDAVGEMRRLFGAREPIGETIGSSPDSDTRTLDRLVARASRKGAAIRAILAAGSHELIVACFAEAHTGGHQLWEYRRDTKGDGPRPDHGLGDGLLRLYQAIDVEIGHIIDALPPTANVFVVSSVGLLSQYPTEALTEAICRQLGYQAAPRTASRTKERPSPMGILRRLLPERARNLLSSLLSIEVQARLLSQKFAAATDWSRTTVFAPPGYYTGCLRVNLRGREPRGIVEEGVEYEALLDRLEADFTSLTHPDTGEPVVERTVRTRATFGSSLHAALPDLVIVWREHDRPLSSVVHACGRITQSPHPFHRGSHHITQGMLIGAGPSVRAAGKVADVNPLALAPTLLALLQLTPPDSMTSVPLHEWLATPPPAALTT